MPQLALVPALAALANVERQLLAVASGKRMDVVLRLQPAGISRGEELGARFDVALREVPGRVHNRRVIRPQR